VTADTKESIERINDVSRQLLSCIQSVRTSLKPSNNKSIENTESLPSNKELSELSTARQTLITHLFEHNATEDISSETVLLQEMLALDSELTANSTLSKQELAEQVVKLKKSKKVKKSYQKY
jgi:hypothetical protein